MKPSKRAVYWRALRLRRLQVQQRLSRIGIPDYSIFTILSVITGLVAGLAAVSFHHFVDFLDTLFFEHGSTLFGVFAGLAVIVLPALGMLIQSLMIHLDPLTARKRGVMEVIKAVAMRGGHISLRTTLFHFFAPAVSIGSGNTVGPEGPIAQLGGGVASNLGRLFGLSDTRRRVFTAAGSGAAIAAVFNTPLGGIFFALEVILLNDFQAPTFSALILASVAASAVSRIFLGNEPTFSFGEIAIGPYEHLYLYAVLGVGAGIISLLYINYSEALHGYFRQRLLPRLSRWMLMTAVGLLVGGCGYFYPEIFGIGYHAINKILASELSWEIVLVLLGMKFLLVPLILHSGGFGGIFAPSLFMGACFGFLFAMGVNNFLGFSVDITTYALVSMGAILGAVNSIPISAILIIFEMTREYSFILPLMLAVVTSTTIVHLIIKGSIYDKHLEREGYRIAHGRESNILQSLRVKSVMRDEAMIIPGNLPLPELISMLMESPYNTFYTLNREGKLTGIISESELRPIISEYEHLRQVLIAKDIARPGVVTVREDDDLDFVLRLFGQENLDEFPVVSAEDGTDQIIGCVTRQDVIAAYNRESLRQNLVTGLVHDLKLLEKSPAVAVSEQYSIAECRPPKHFIGKTLSQLKLRNKYNLEVLMIRKTHSPLAAEEENGNILIPPPDYRIHHDDTLVVFGRNDDVAQARRWS